MLFKADSGPISGSGPGSGVPGRIEFWTTNPAEDDDVVQRMVIKNNGKVGIGTENPLGPLHVQTTTEASPLILRNLAGTAGQSSVAAITPALDRLWFTYGCYVEDDGDFEHDAYQSTGYNCKLALAPRDGVYWYASNNAPGDYWGLTGGGSVRLWDEHGTWVAPATCCVPSSRTLKENFCRLNKDDILGKLEQLEVSRWNYKTDNKSVTHIGPVAEDFYRIFKTGSKESEMYLMDSVGVSLMGVKALSEKVRTQERRMEELQAEIESLKSQLKKVLK
jgi:hypothetical protein